jgi:hypothetical protein
MCWEGTHPKKSGIRYHLGFLSVKHWPPRADRRRLRSRRTRDLSYRQARQLKQPVEEV